MTPPNDAHGKRHRRARHTRQADRKPPRSVRRPVAPVLRDDQATLVRSHARDNRPRLLPALENQGVSGQLGDVVRWHDPLTFMRYRQISSNGWNQPSVSDGLKHRSVGTEGFEPSLEAV